MSQQDSSESFVHLWQLWYFGGLHGSSTWSYSLYRILLNLITNVLSPLTLFLNLFYTKSAALVFHNLEFSLTIIVSSIKQMIAFAKLSDFLRAKQLLLKLDSRASRNEQEVKFLKAVTKQCRTMIPTVASVFMVSLLFVAVSHLLKGILLFDEWLPFDWASSSKLYHFAFLFQFVVGAIQCLQSAANDSCPAIYMNTIRGHIRALCMRVSRIGYTPTATAEDNYTELKLCIRDHKDIIRLFETVKPIISLTVLAQLIVTAFVTCMAAISCIVLETNLKNMIMSGLYIFAILLKSFPVCFCANMLMEEANSLTSAIYSCNWTNQSLRFRKSIIIFMQRSQRTKIIRAGGLVPICLDTFTGIIRFSISMFAVLGQLN